MSNDSLQFRIMRWINEMDFQSQKTAQKFYKRFIIIVAIIAYLVGWVFQSFKIPIISTIAAMIVSYIVIVPGQAPWWKHSLPPFQPQSARQKSKKS